MRAGASPWRVPAALATAAVLVVGAPVVALHDASAARLPVTAAPLQTWRIGDLPHPTLPPGPDLGMCGDLDRYDEVIVGTAGDDVLVAGNGRQVLVGLGGDDVLSSGNHNDCLVGGPGDDRLMGGNGLDLLFGEDGVDHLDGGTGKDVLDAGGDPGDSCVSDGAPDKMSGCGEDPGVLTAPGTSESDSRGSQITGSLR